MTDINHATNTACRDLPQGYAIILTLERDSMELILEDPMGIPCRIEEEEMSLEDQILDATKRAMDQEARRGRS